MYADDQNLAPDLAWMLQSGQASESIIVETLLAEVSRPVYHLALSILDDPRAAQLAVVQTFLTALRSAHRYRNDGEVKLWLYSLAIRRCRRLRLGLRWKRAWQAALPARRPELEAEQPLPRTGLEADLWLAVDALPHAKALPLLLHYVHNQTIPELAQVMGASEAMVQKRLAAAWRTLEKRWLPERLPRGELEGYLAASLQRRWPDPGDDPELRRTLQAELAGRLATKAVRSPQKLALSALAVVLIAGIGLSSIWLFPEEDHISLVINKSPAANRAANATPAPTPRYEARLLNPPATAEAELLRRAQAIRDLPPAETDPEGRQQSIPGIPENYRLELPLAFIDLRQENPPKARANSGSIALARVLQYWGQEIDISALTRSLQPNPADENVMPYELVNYTAENTPLKGIYRLGGDFPTLARLTSAGFPVVLQHGYETADTGGWTSQYAIATGYDLRAGETIRLVTARDFEPVSKLDSHALLASWQAFNYAYLVVYPEGDEAVLAQILGTQFEEDDSYRVAANKAMQEIGRASGLARFFAWFNRGTSLTYLEDYAGAAMAYDEAFAIYASLRLEQRPWRMLWYQSRPYWAYYYTGRYLDVIALADTTLASREDLLLEESLYWRALARKEMGDLEGAIEDLTESLRMNPNFQAGSYQLEQIQGGG